MNFFKKSLFLSVCLVAAAVCLTTEVSAQSRDRVVRTSSSQPTNLPPAAEPKAPLVKPLSSSRPILTNEIVVVKAATTPAAPLVKKTGSSMATAARSMYGAGTTQKLDQAIKSRYGIRYVYGSSGPNSYDCSGFVWSAFQEAGIHFTRSSARTLWSQSDPVEGDERFKFGTLVFLNGLGHMGIVADENGFYHASSSKGITYSPFKGYWGKRIVGFRRLRAEATVQEAK